MQVRCLTAACALGISFWIAVFDGTVAGQQGRQGSPFREDPAYDRLVSEFIAYDIGQIRDPARVARIRRQFASLTCDDAVPALVRGLNRAARLRYSCPITALSGRLISILQRSSNPQVATYIMRHLDRGYRGAYASRVQRVFRAAEARLMRTGIAQRRRDRLHRRAAADQRRLAYVPGLKLSQLKLRVPEGAAGEQAAPMPDQRPRSAAPPSDSRQSRSGPSRPAALGAVAATSAQTAPSGLSLEQLGRLLTRPASQRQATDELLRRAVAGQVRELGPLTEPVLKVLAAGQPASQQSAARLLGLLRCRRAVPALISALESEDRAVRSAAATALTRITGQLFGPRDEAGPDEVARAVSRWRRWWQRRGRGGE